MDVHSTHHPGRYPVALQQGRCAEAHLGCPCRGDESIHEERSAALRQAREQAGEPVTCPECGGPTTQVQIVSWGNCRSCRTAQSREVYPLRW